MFRNVPNPFGGGQGGGDGQHPPRDRYNAAPQQPYRDSYGHDSRMSGGHGNPNRAPMPSRPGGGRMPPSGAPGGDRVWHLRPAKSPDNSYIFGNVVAVSPRDIPPSRDGTDILLLLNNTYVFTARPLEGFPPGQISMSDPQRSWAQVSLMDTVEVKLYDVFSQGSQAYIASMDMEIAFAGRKRTDLPYEQDHLAQVFTKNFENQVLAPGQKILMDDKNVPLILTVKKVQVGDLSEKGASMATPQSTDPYSRGILTRYTSINFYKDAKSDINLKASLNRPPANAIIQPDFKFENMGIGGLDKEFTAIFRRAFASRLLPPGFMERLGIQYVKGILLYGPPGTGKTLIARQIGKMLNAREPKVINGPEVLNKYVGQSEENIRKLFADAEKEYKEKGEESGLHIIIFDELDAVCKQRGSGAGGGTGVGDSVVNQLLSKLDGVDQLNNILLIGMTNRKDMIDDALLRPGRLEVHMEISLPDEYGRVQILNIHTKKIQEGGMLDKDVDIMELGQLTKNFSGAELSGLVRSASAFAVSRHTKQENSFQISDDIASIKVCRQDFLNALEEVKPAFGVSEEELEAHLGRGIIHFSPTIDTMLGEGKEYVSQVRQTTPLLSVLLHGPAGCGKTALAARMAIDSEFPFVKLISSEHLAGLNEMAKIQHINKVFMDAYKSVNSLVVIDDIEGIIEWNPVGPRFSNPILHIIRAKLRTQPEKGRRLLILATTAERSMLEHVNIYKSFNRKISVPNIKTYEEVAYVLQANSFSAQESEVALSGIRELTQSNTIGVGIKDVLLGIHTAEQNPDKARRFAEVIASDMAGEN